MLTGKQKFATVLRNIKKLNQSRQTYWLTKIKTLRNKYRSAELGVPPAKASVKPSSSDWLLDTANWLDKVYSSVGTSASETTLAVANEMDKIYNGVAVEAKNFGKSYAETTHGAGNVVGGTLGGVLGGFLDRSGIRGDGYAPYLFGAVAALAAYVYLVGPRRMV